MQTRGGGDEASEGDPTSVECGVLNHPPAGAPLPKRRAAKGIMSSCSLRSGSAQMASTDRTLVQGRTLMLIAKLECSIRVSHCSFKSWNKLLCTLNTGVKLQQPASGTKTRRSMTATRVPDAIAGSEYCWMTPRALGRSSRTARM